MLIENTLFGTIDKVADSIRRIQFHEPQEGYFVAFSGGKDSVVLLDLVKKAGVKYDAHYNLTTVDPPELVKFIRKDHPEVQIHKPALSMWQLIVKKRMPPTRIIRFCCKYLKEDGGKGRFVLTGIRWAESVRRSNRSMVESCTTKRRRLLHPIIDWSDAEVWQYIHENGAKYCSLYNDGFTRLGCIGCPMGNIEQKTKQFQRWPKYKESYLRAFSRCLQARIKDGLPPVSEDWVSAEGVMDWWINGSDKGDPDQTVMFE